MTDPVKTTGGQKPVAPGGASVPGIILRTKPVARDCSELAMSYLQIMVTDALVRRLLRVCSATNKMRSPIQIVALQTYRLTKNIVLRLSEREGAESHRSGWFDPNIRRRQARRIGSAYRQLRPLNNGPVRSYGRLGIYLPALRRTAMTEEPR